MLKGRCSVSVLLSLNLNNFGTRVKSGLYFYYMLTLMDDLLTFYSYEGGVYFYRCFWQIEG